MPCDCCQILGVELRAKWTDNAVPIEETAEIYDAGPAAFRLLEDSNDTGTSWNFAMNGGLIGRGDDPDVPGDHGYVMTIDFRNIKFPIPATFVFDEVFRAADDNHEIGRSEVRQTVKDVDTWTAPYVATTPGANQSVWAENFRIYPAKYADNV